MMRSKRPEIKNLPLLGPFATVGTENSLFFEWYQFTWFPPKHIRLLVVAGHADHFGVMCWDNWPWSICFQPPYNVSHWHIVPVRNPSLKITIIRILCCLHFFFYRRCAKQTALFWGSGILRKETVLETNMQKVYRMNLKLSLWRDPTRKLLSFFKNWNHEWSDPF